MSPSNKLGWWFESVSDDSSFNEAINLWDLSDCSFNNSFYYLKGPWNDNELPSWNFKSDISSYTFEKDTQYLLLVTLSNETTLTINPINETTTTTDSLDISNYWIIKTVTTNTTLSQVISETNEWKDISLEYISEINSIKNPGPYNNNLERKDWTVNYNKNWKFKTMHFRLFF